MPRPRGFDEAEVLRAAMMVFWRDGYDATTYRALEAETGVGVRSMHNTFGEKDRLFVRVLRLYREQAEKVVNAAFATPGLAAIAGFFDAMAAAQSDAGDVSAAGCLMVNTVFELGQMPEEIAAEVAAYRAMWRDAFARSLEADGIEKAAERAEFLLGSLWGMLSQIRLARDVSAAAPMARVVSDTVRGWRSGRQAW